MTEEAPQQLDEPAATDRPEPAPDHEPGGVQEQDEKAHAQEAARGFDIADALLHPGKRAQAGDTERILADIRAALSEDGLSAAELKIGGDVVAGAKFVQNNSIHYDAGTDLVLHVLTDEELAEYDDHVPAPEHPSLRQCVEDSPLTVLAGPAGWGRTATAVDLLRSTGATSIALVDPDSDLTTLETSLFRTGTGLLVPDCTANSLRRLPEARLKKLLGVLRKGQGRMVITSEVSPADFQTSLHEHVAMVGEPAPRHEILRCFVSRWIGDEKQDELVRSDAATRWLEQNPRASARETVRFALQLVSEQDLAVLAVQERRRQRADVDEKIADTSCWQWPWLLAAAVHNGRRWSDAVESAERLFELFELEERDERQTALAKMKEWFERTSIVQDISLGSVPIEVVHLHNRESRAWVVERIWKSGGTYRAPILTWLRELGAGHHDTVVRHSAAATVGQLMKLDFVEVAYSTVEKWVKHERLDCTQSAAIALSFAADDSALRSAVVRWAQSWAHTKEESRKLAAAAAFGAALGTRTPQQALVALDELMRNASSRLRYRVALSLADLAVYQPDVLLPSVLSLLTHWAGSRRNLKQGSVVAFMMLANDFLDTEGTTSVPKLLVTSHEGGAHADRLADLARLWHVALTDPGLYKIARRHFGQWAEMCDLSPSHRGMFVDLAVLVARDDQRGAEIVRRIAETWQDGEHEVFAPLTSTSVLKELDGAGANSDVRGV